MLEVDTQVIQTALRMLNVYYVPYPRRSNL